MQRTKGARVLGPYHDRTTDRWKITIIDSQDRRSFPTFESEADAREGKEQAEDRLKQQPVPQDKTVCTAITEYEQHLTRVKGNKPRSITGTGIRLRRFFPEDRPLSAVTPRYCAGRYEALVEELAVDSHRNYLAEARTFLAWCCDKPRRWLGKNPLDEVKGQGRRNPGGKGKRQPRLDEWVKWQTRAEEIAGQGEAGAVAAALAAEAIDASAIVTLRVRDVDQRGALLWVGEEEAKTEGRRRPVKVPAWLTPHLLALCEGALPTAYLFRTSKGKSGHPWRDWPREWIQRICDQVGIPRTHAHGLRGFAATLAILGGADAAIGRAGQQLGHAPGSSMTLASYASDEAVEDARQDARVLALKGSGERT